MRVHHLNCGTLCPIGGRLVSGTGGLFERARMVCHCLLIESDDGLVLVDTGLGLGDLERRGARLGSPFVTVTAPRLDPEETAARQVERLGWKRSDVRHIIPTHLDLDHAGGLSDFPDATVHIFHKEHDAALHPANINERSRYVQAQWAHGPRWDVLRVSGERWMGFDSVRAVGDVGTDVLLVPLLGHTRGHCGVAVRTAAGWLLHAGDAYFTFAEMQTPPKPPAALELFQRLVAADGPERLANQARLRDLATTHSAEVQVFCAHCPTELGRLTAAASPARQG